MLSKDLIRLFSRFSVRIHQTLVCVELGDYSRTRNPQLPKFLPLSPEKYSISSHSLVRGDSALHASSPITSIMRMEESFPA